MKIGKLSAIAAVSFVLFVSKPWTNHLGANELSELQKKVEHLQSQVEQLQSKQPEKSSLFTALGWVKPRTYKEAATGTSFAWKTAGGNYADPTSFFFLHGYVNSVFAKFVGGGNAEDTAGNPLPAPGQLGLPAPAGNGAFQADWALFLGSEIAENLKVIYEHHWVKSGNGNKITEMNVQWAPVKNWWVSGGLYWAPFGILNQDWLQAQNLFATIPNATRAFPFHSNVVGFRVNGDYAVNDAAGVNLVLSLDNGSSGMSIAQQELGGDSNDNKQVQGRLGIFPGLGKNLEIGYSFALDRFRNAEQALANRSGKSGTTATDPLSYPAFFTAHGLDLTAHALENRLKVRGYYINSRENLEGDPTTTGAGASFSATDVGALLRQGLMGEASFVFLKDVAKLKEVLVKLRYDQSWVENLALVGGTPTRVLFNDRVTSLGLEVKPHQHVRIGVEYHIAEELGRQQVDNNGVVVKMTGEF